MRALASILGLQTAKSACEQVPLVSAWLQHLLHNSCCSMHTSSSTSSSSSTSVLQEDQSRPQPADRRQNMASAADLAYAVGKQHPNNYQFSIRPSALSPLHPWHRECQEEARRMQLLELTLQAHIKLAEELHPKELQEHAGSSDPVAAALAARRAALQTAFNSYVMAATEHIEPVERPEHMYGYYSVLELLVRQNDEGLKQFHEVVKGERSVWDYWFQQFTPAYAGLPSLGTMESIYNQQSEEVLLQQLSQLKATSEKPPPQPKVDRWGRAAAVGGRKTSVARVYVWRGQGRVLVNRNPLDGYFGDLLMRSHVLKPLMVTGLVDQLDVLVHVHGGGISGQAQATAHGIAKALVRLDPALKPALKSAKLLRRDPRAVERKKFGKAKARKGFAWVKR